MVASSAGQKQQAELLTGWLDDFFFNFSPSRREAEKEA